MRIVVLDGYTLNPGDLSWSGLEALGELKVYEHTKPEEAAARAAGCEVVITNKTPLPRAVIEMLPELKYIGLLATGYNVVDVACARERGIPVTNIPTYGTRSVAQMVFALLLTLCHRVELHSEAVKQGEWSRNRDFCFWHTPQLHLEGKTMGIIGFGRIGQKVADLAEAFGMRVVACNRTRSDQTHRPDFRWLELDELLQEADVVSLHCPLVPETEGLMNRSRLARMKPEAFLINTSRGPLIEEQALADALYAGRLGGAALDVLTVEPPPAEHPLYDAPNCILTPHIAWATPAARSRLMEIAVDNVRQFLDGKPVNVVNV